MQNRFTDTDELFIKKGTMTQSPFEMNTAELKTWKAKLGQSIRERLFTIGQPLVYEKDGKFVAEYADGRIQTL